jgi:hypothetical protein
MALGACFFPMASVMATVLASVMEIVSGSVIDTRGHQSGLHINQLTHFSAQIFKNLTKLDALYTDGNSATTRNVDFSENPNVRLFNETKDNPYRRG